MPGAAVRTLTLLLTADSAALSSTLYRSSLEVARYQTAVEQANNNTGRQSVQSVLQRNAAEMTATNERIAQQEKATLAFAKSMTQEVVDAEVAAAKKLQIETELAVKREAIERERAVRQVFTVGTDTTITEINEQKALKADSIRETEALAKKSASDIAKADVTAAKLAAAEEIAIAERTAEEKVAAYAKVSGSQVGLANVAALAEAEKTMQVAQIREAEAAKIESVKATEAAAISSAAKIGAVERTENAATATEKVKATRVASTEQLALALDEIEAEKAARMLATAQTTASTIENAKVAGANQLRIAEQNAVATAAFQREQAGAAIAAQQASQLKAVEAETAARERQAKVMGVLKTTTLAFGLVAAAATAESVKLGIDFDKEMRNVASISDQLQGNEALLQSTGNKVLEISAQYPKAAKDLANGLYEITSSGFNENVNEALKVLNQSTRAATAGLTTTDTAAKGLTEVMNAYGLEAYQAGHVSDVLFQTVNYGIVTFEQLTNTLGKVLGGAAAAGVGIEELGAAFAAVTRSGVGPEETATSLNRVILSFVKPTAELTALTKTWGYESAQTAVEQQGLYKTMMRVNEATGGSIEALRQLFPDMRATRGVFALLANDGKNYAETFDAIGQTNSSAGATQRALNEQLKSTAAQLGILKNEAAAVGIRFSAGFLKVINDAIPGVKDFAGAIGKDAVTAFRILEPGLDAVGRLLMDFWKISGDVAQVILSVARPAFAVLAGTFDIAAISLQKITHFLAENETAVKLVATVVGGLLVAAWLNHARAMAINVGIKIFDWFTNMATGANAAAAAQIRLTAAQAAGRTVSGSLVGAFSAAKTALGEYAATMGPAIAVAVSYGLALRALQIELNAPKAQKKKAMGELDDITKDEDKNTVESVDRAIAKVKAAANESILLGNQGGHGDLAGRAESYAKEYLGPLLQLRQNAEENTKGIQDELRKLFNDPNLTLSMAQVSSMAKETGVDITKSFDSSEEARDRIIAFFRNKFPASLNTAGLDFSKMTAEQLEQYLELQSAADTYGKKVAEAFSKAYDPSQQFKAVDPEDQHQKVLTSEKAIADAEKKLDALNKKKATGGTTAAEQDAVTAATIRTERAQSDLNSTKLKGQGIFSQSNKHDLETLEAYQKSTETELSAAIKQRDALNARRAAGDSSVTDANIVQANAAVLFGQEKQKQAIKDIADAKHEGDKIDEKTTTASTNRALTAARKKEDAERALEIAQRKAKDNPFTEDDQAEIDRLKEVVATAKKELADQKKLDKPLSVQLTEFYSKQIEDARKFNSDLTTLMTKGLDPSIVMKLLEQGPKQAKDYVDALVAGNVDATIMMVNNSQKELDKLAERALYMSRLNFLATNSGDTGLLSDLKNAAKIQDEILNQGQTGTVESVAKKLGLNVDLVKKISQEFGILGAKDPTTGLQKNFSAVEMASQKTEEVAVKTPNVIAQAWDIAASAVDNYAGKLKNLFLSEDAVKNFKESLTPEERFASTANKVGSSIWKATPKVGPTVVRDLHAATSPVTNNNTTNNVAVHAQTLDPGVAIEAGKSAARKNALAGKKK